MISETKSAPFTQEEVDALNDYQSKGKFHPFTCCGGNKNTPNCFRIKDASELDPNISYADSEGILKATKDGWVCPCGEYTQNWAHSFMSEKQTNESN